MRTFLVRTFLAQRLLDVRPGAERAEGELNAASRLREPPLTTCLIFLLLALVFFGAIRFRLRNMPLERDEGEYAYAGQLMLAGIPPYQLAYNMKLPGIYAAYAAVLAVFGQTPAGIHIGLMLLNAATTLLIFFLTARLFGRLAGFVAGCSYALLSTSGSVMGFEAHATNFVVFPALLGILLLLCGLRNGRSWLFFLSGLCCGVGFLMKQHGVFFIIFCFVFLVWSEWAQRRSGILWKHAAVFVAGALLPYVLTCWLMYRQGVFGQFWFWTVDYAGEYSKIGLRRAIRTLFETSRHVVARPFLIWGLAAVGFTAIYWNAAARRHSRFLILFLLCSFLALCPGGYFRPHYYILLFPAVAMLAGVGVYSLAELRRESSAAVPLVIFFFCLGTSVLLQEKMYFFLSPEDAVRATYSANAFVPAVAVSDYVREHSPQDAKIAVLGSEPEIYFYAHRHSATGYLYMYSLIIHHKYTARMRDQMMSELETNRPLYVVYVDVWDDWGPQEGGPQLAEFLPRLHAFMDRSYEVIGVASVGESTKYYWDAEAKDYRPDASQAIYVLRRKAGE